jgi:hypothetical protein
MKTLVSRLQNLYVILMFYYCWFHVLNGNGVLKPRKSAKIQKNVGQFSREKISQKWESRYRSVPKLRRINEVQGFWFQLTTVCTRGEIPWGVLETFGIPGNSEKMSDGFLTRIFPGIPQGNPQGFSRFFSWNDVAIKYVKSVDFGCFQGPISRFQNPEFKSGTHFVHFRNFGDFKSRPWNPVFQTALQQSRGIRKFRGFRGFREISGTLYTIDKKNFGNGNSRLTLLHFFFCFRVSSVQRCEKRKPQMTLWGCAFFPKFSRVFSGFQDFQLRIRVKFRKKGVFDVFGKALSNGCPLRSTHEAKIWTSVQKTDTFFQFCILRTMKCEISGKRRYN